MMRDLMPSTIPPKSSPGYRAGEQEAIQQFLAQRGATKCPGFGCGEDLPIIRGEQGRKNDQLIARRQTDRRRNLAAETQARERTIQVMAEYEQDSAPGWAHRIGAKLGIAHQTVREHLDRGLGGKLQGKNAK